LIKEANELAKTSGEITEGVMEALEKDKKETEATATKTEPVKKAAVPVTLYAGTKDVVRDPNNHKITHYQKTDIKTIPGKDSNTPDTTQTTIYRVPKN
jgi:hypothetical protein